MGGFFCFFTIEKEEDKMNIGIDIDGVLIDFERQVLDYGIKTCVEEKW